MCSIYPFPNFMTTYRVIAKTDGSSADLITILEQQQQQHSVGWTQPLPLLLRRIGGNVKDLPIFTFQKLETSLNINYWNVNNFHVLIDIFCFSNKQVSVWKCVVANNFLFFSTLNVNWVAASWTLNLSALRKEKSLVCSDEGGYWG